MKKLIFLIVTICLSQNLSAQKVDLDNEYVERVYVRLPEVPTFEKAKRTYSLRSNIGEVEEGVDIEGLKRLNSNASIKIQVQINQVQVLEVKVDEEKHEEKNDKGVVTRRWSEFHGIIICKTSGDVKYRSPNKKNMFYIGSKQTKKQTYDTYKKAAAYVNNNNIIVANIFQSDFYNSAVYTVSDRLTRTFGCKKIIEKELFQILDSKKNPEYDKYKQAYNDIITLLGKINIDTDVSTLEPDVKKIEEYFLSVIPKFPKKKRKHRKMRFASYYNIAKLYLCIENFDKAKEFAQKLIDNDYKKKHGRRINKQIDGVMKSLEINKLKTRHFIISDFS